jgi:hypothetical protein
MVFNPSACDLLLLIRRWASRSPGPTRAAQAFHRAIMVWPRGWGQANGLQGSPSRELRPVHQGGASSRPVPSSIHPCACQIGGGFGRRLAGYGLNRVAGMSRRRRGLPRMGSRLDTTRVLTQAIQGSPAYTPPDRPWMAVAIPSIAPQAFVTRGRSRLRRDIRATQSSHGQQETRETPSRRTIGVGGAPETRSRAHALPPAATCTPSPPLLHPRPPLL